MLRVSAIWFIAIFVAGFSFPGCTSGEPIVTIKEFVSDNGEMKNPVLLETVHIDGTPSAKSYRFSLNYTGRYDVSLFLNQKGMSAAGRAHNSGLPIRLRGSVSIKGEDGSVIKSQDFDWQKNRGFLGETIFVFESPKEVLKKSDSYIDIEIYEASKGFNEEYESINVVIKRLARFLD